MDLIVLGHLGSDAAPSSVLGVSQGTVFAKTTVRKWPADRDHYQGEVNQTFEPGPITA